MIEVLSFKSKYLAKTYYVRKSDFEKSNLRGHGLVKYCKKNGDYYSENYKDAPLRLVHKQNLI